MKVLVIKTNEILDLNGNFSTRTLNVKGLTIEGLLNGKKISMEWQNDKKEIFLLSDGNQYQKDELIIGINEIRDYKIKNNLN